MKRSRVVRLALLGSASALALASCDDAKDPLADNKSFFQDPAQCATVYDPETCKAAFASAQEEHRKTAPKFTSREECEEKFGVGNCQWGQAQPGQQASSGGGGFFMPLMMGYMMGNMMGGATSSGSSSGFRSSGSGFSSSPVYRDTSNTVYSGSRSLGTTSISAAPSSRGGFGSSARASSSGS